MHPGREVIDPLFGHFGRNDDLDLATGQQFSRPFYFFSQFGSAGQFPLVVAASDATQCSDQLNAIDEESSAGLIAAELVHELDGAPAADAKDLFKARAIDDRYIQSFELVENPWKLCVPADRATKQQFVLLRTTDRATDARACRTQQGAWIPTDDKLGTTWKSG